MRSDYSQDPLSYKASYMRVRVMDILFVRERSIEPGWKLEFKIVILDAGCIIPKLLRQ